MRSKHRSSTSVLKVDPPPEKIEFRRYNRTKRDIKTHRRKERKERTRTSEIKGEKCVPNTEAAHQFRHKQAYYRRKDRVP
jgi:hypothetical protein